MVVWKPDWKKLFMVQNVWYSNGQPSYMILPFEYHTVRYSGVWYSDGYCMCEYLFNVKQKTHSYNAFLHVSKYNLFDVRLFWVGTERLYIKGWVYWNVSPAQMPVIQIPTVFDISTVRIWVRSARFTKVLVILLNLWFLLLQRKSLLQETIEGIVCWISALGYNALSLLKIDLDYLHTGCHWNDLNDLN